MNEILFVGGDKRMLHAAEQLNKAYPCSLYGFEKAGPLPLPQWDGAPRACAVLPLPASSDGENVSAPLHFGEIPFRFLGSAVKSGGVIFTSREFPKLRDICDENGITLENYFSREELQLKNALPTAEGALEILIRELDVTVRGAKILILGFGRIGEITADMLVSLGAETTVLARSPVQRAKAELIGCKARDLGISEGLEAFDCVINTVPALVFGEDKVSKLKKGCLIIDLASVRGTADVGGVRTIHALSLPGKTAPVTAGKIIGETIEFMLKEKREKEG